MHSSTPATFGLFSAVVWNLMWLLALCAKNTHGLRVCRCSRCCLQCLSLLPGGMLKKLVACAVPYTLCSTWPESSGSLALPAGLSSTRTWSLHVNAAAWPEFLHYDCICRKSWVCSSFAPLSPSCCCFYFPAPSKEVLMHIEQEGNIQELFLWQPVKSKSSVC